MTLTHTPEPGTALWLYAHPLRGSLNDHLFQAGTEALSEQYTVLTSDLHAQRFDPVLGDRDFGGRTGSIVQITADAYRRGEHAADVREEQAKLAAAELLVIQFPLWWYGPPAILKGWFDRVLTNEFAYGDVDSVLGIPRRYGDGQLAGRRALVIVTVGEDARSLGTRGISGDIDSLLFPLTHGTLWYTGVGSFDLHVIYDADSLGSEGLQQETERLRDRLKAIDSEPADRFRRLADGDYHGTRALREDIHPGRTDLGIHLSEALG
ncbi:NAD(P)H-dependent oxidoreductase [Mycolicibacterium smegmatis]|uniref:NAD(P)H dehydrogenase (Quinone) n=5 Tax=Mycolicibacterium smegmatis TaxID=1772 RepID=I7FCX0_MYCS2|nr:NAD(P)H-dependent oxidoreductase [Mycolicibacterium smegmatis]ABK70726.1 ribosyldihydronicotinamide dehydrogenase (quinone) [Mycolicibacterium smegmatis MC2 155]AFP36758.1 NAD(P)H dehydrogenase (Quinone) [Mycolicibacterium smegmatis MC2 155]AIU05563.1 NADPH-quinone reductase [Mycolicibacterium smegmatis MC2 155]AIU12188.1 NADPH-quinone reductase [Mycolicibacterium smegmatis]AIU18812.1 NADPH-quinone reductase [Mycolicibacterium smegmatis]